MAAEAIYASSTPLAPARAESAVAGWLEAPVDGYLCQVADVCLDCKQ